MRRINEITHMNKYMLSTTFVFSIAIFIIFDMNSFNIMTNMNILPQKLISGLYDTNGTFLFSFNQISARKLQSELKKEVFDYLKNLTKINDTYYLALLEKSLNTLEISPEFKINEIKKTGPAIIPKSLRIPRTNLKFQGIRLPLITGKPFGRLGNMMGEYATLFALGRLYNVTVLLHPDMKNKLKLQFPFLTMKNLPLILRNNKEWITLHKQQNHSNYSPLELAAGGLLGPNIFCFEDWPFEIHLFNSIRKEITSEFIFSARIIDKANSFLQMVKKEVNTTSPITYIGIHIRRTDYVTYIHHFSREELPDELFYQRALHYYRQKYSTPIFIATSDDKDYLNATFNMPDVYIVPGGSAINDLAILASCNHSIFTVGSYGFWGSYLAGGEVVYPDLPTKIPYIFSKNFYEKAKLKNFIPISIR